MATYGYLKRWAEMFVSLGLVAEFATEVGAKLIDYYWYVMPIVVVAANGD